MAVPTRAWTKAVRHAMPSVGCAFASGPQQSFGRAERTAQAPQNESVVARVSAVADHHSALPGIYTCARSSSDLTADETRRAHSGRSLRLIALSRKNLSDKIMSECWRRAFHEVAPQDPNNTGHLSSLRYAYALTETVFRDSNAEIVSLEMAPTKKGVHGEWTMSCILSNNGSKHPDSTDVSIRLVFSTYWHHVGLRDSPSDLHGDVKFELLLQPKSRFIGPLQETRPPVGDTNRKTIEGVVTDLASAFQEDVIGYIFESPQSFMETAVTRLEMRYKDTVLHDYLDLERVNLTANRHDKLPAHRFEYTRSPTKRGAGEQLTQPAFFWRGGRVWTALSSYTKRNTGCDSVKLNSPEINSPSTLSEVAQSLEKTCASSGLNGLASVLVAGCELVQSLPGGNDIAIRLSVVNELRGTGMTKRPRILELRKTPSEECPEIHIKVRMDKPYTFRVRGAKASPTIVVNSIVLKVAPLSADVVSLWKKTPSSCTTTADHEIAHLMESVDKVLERVCSRVAFDRHQSAPYMLSEAILRVVRPLTPGLSLEEVSINFRYPESRHLAQLKRTVSLADLSTPGDLHSGRSPFESLQPGTRLLTDTFRLLQDEEWSSLTRANAKLTGFGYEQWHLVQSEPAMDGSDNDSQANRHLCRGALEDLESGNLVGLQTAVRRRAKQARGDVVLTLDLAAEPMGTGGLDHNNNPSRHYPANVVLPSDGLARCFMPIMTHLRVCLEDHEPGSMTPVDISWRCTGTLPDSCALDLSAYQQLETMNRIVAARLAIDVQGKVFADKDDLAQEVADAIDRVKNELAEHIIIESTSVFASLLPGLERSDQATAMTGRPAESAPLDVSHRRDSVMGGTPMLADGEAVHAAVLTQLTQQLDRALAVASLPQDEQAEQVGATESESHAPISTRRMQRGVVVALGSNVGNKIEEIEKACRAIDADPDMRIVDTSCLYETEPMYVEDQEKFVNGACEIETSLTPIELLDRLQAIEQGHGRVKLIDKGPRNIDLDIAIFRDQVVDSERLTVPHMLMHEREFVIRPILDLLNLKDWRNPRTQDALRDSLHRLFCPKNKRIDTLTPLTDKMHLHCTAPNRPTHVMSILNTTPDSFSDGGVNALDPQSLKETAAAHIAAGATIIDLGGQSSRPNAPDVSAEEEIERVLPAIAAIRSLPESEGIAISIDTYRAAVAEAAVNAGAHIVNDISAGTMDPHMLQTVAKLGCTYIMMHMRGTPATMQNAENCQYHGPFFRLLQEEMAGRMEAAMQSGIRAWRIILDPGIGFAKTQHHNLALLRNRGIFDGLNLRRIPTLVGSSRKGFIGNITGVEEPQERVFGTAATVTAAIAGGADIVRVHDVKEMAQVAKMSDAIYRISPERRP